MVTVLPAAKLVPSVVKTRTRSFDSSEWNAPDVPSAQASLMVLGWLGSGPSDARPRTSEVPVSHELPTVAHFGACRTASNTAVPPGLEAVTVTVSVALAAPSPTVRRNT